MFGVLKEGSACFDALQQPLAPAEILAHGGAHLMLMRHRPPEDIEAVGHRRTSPAVGLLIGGCLRMPSLMYEHLVGQHKTAIGCGGEAQVDIIVGLECRGGHGHECQQAAVEEDGVSRDGTVEQANEVIVGRAGVEGCCLAGVGEGPGAACAEQMPVDGGHLLLYLLWFPDVILVADGDIFSPRLGKRTDEVVVDAFPRRIDGKTDVGMLLAIGLSDLCRMVGGVVVLNDDFHEGIGLPEQTV